MRSDFVIIGAGIAGIAARRALRGDVVQLDPRPACYKIGESIVPEQFHHPLMREALPVVRQCESYSPKIGTTFVGGGAVACFPLRSHRLRTMHIYRPDMEQTLLSHFGIDVRPESVLEVDVAARTVRTEAGVYESRGPIIDCSGPAMVVASSLGEIEQLWPVHATWAYYDVLEVDDRRFWRTVDERGWTSSFLDIPSGRLMGDHTRDMFPPSLTTGLTQIRPGTWMWQIPLWGRKRLSVGVVTRGEPLSVADFRSLVTEHALPCYTLEARPENGDSPLDRIHRRSSFAKRAKRAATEDAILLGDAFSFADPIYSVGTGLATNKAIAIGRRLSAGPWTAADAQQYCADYDALLERAIRAFGFWYSGEVMRDDSAAMEVQTGFLQGHAFEKGALEAYSAAVFDAVDVTDAWVTDRVLELLGPNSDPGEWRLEKIEPSSSPGSILIRWARRGAGEAVLALGAPNPDLPALRRVHGVRVSHRGSGDLRQDLALASLVDVLCAAVEARPDGWLELLASVA